MKRYKKVETRDGYEYTTIHMEIDPADFVTAVLFVGLLIGLLGGCGA